MRAADRNGKARNCKRGGVNKTKSKRNRLVHSCTRGEGGIGAGGQGKKQVRSRDSENGGPERKAQAEGM